MKEVSAHFSSISRISGHHVQDLPSHLATVLSPCHLQLALSMLRRMETVAGAAAAKVLLHMLYAFNHVDVCTLALQNMLGLGLSVAQEC